MYSDNSRSLSNQPIASESDGPGGTPYAYVFDDKLALPSRGSHYAARRG